MNRADCNILEAAGIECPLADGQTTRGKQKGDTGSGIPTWIIGVIVALVGVIVIMILAIICRRKRGKVNSCPNIDSYRFKSMLEI